MGQVQTSTDIDSAKASERLRWMSGMEHVLRAIDAGAPIRQLVKSVCTRMPSAVVDEIVMRVPGSHRMALVKGMTPADISSMFPMEFLCKAVGMKLDRTAGAEKSAQLVESNGRQFLVAAFGREDAQAAEIVARLILSDGISHDYDDEGPDVPDVTAGEEALERLSEAGKIRRRY